MLSKWKKKKEGLERKIKELEEQLKESTDHERIAEVNKALEKAREKLEDHLLDEVLEPKAKSDQGLSASPIPETDTKKYYTSIEEDGNTSSWYGVEKDLLDKSVERQAQPNKSRSPSPRLEAAEILSSLRADCQRIARGQMKFGKKPKFIHPSRITAAMAKGNK
jgi:hypothetical protein